MARTIDEAENLINKYEEDGVSKLYYSLNRKAWEMADLMNATNLKNLDIADPKDKTFDRLKVVWQDATSIATAVKTLGDIAGISGDELKDIQRRKKPITPESMAQEIGDYKTQNV